MYRTVRENSRLLGGAILILVAGAVFGLVFGDPFATDPVTETPGPVFFFQHNILVAALLLLGAATFGLLTLATLFYNGVAIGFVTGGTDPLLALASIGPHGVVELVGFAIAGAAGFKLPWEITRYLLWEKDWILRSQHFRQTGELALLSALLIAIAAVLEAYLTPAIISAVT